MLPLLLASASTMSLPLCRTVFLISIPCFSKNPCLMPRSSGSAFEIGSVSTVTVVRACERTGCAVAAPPAAVIATIAHAAAPSARTRRPLRPAILGLPCRLLRRGRSGLRDGLLPFDLAVHVAAELRELGQLLRGQLVARAG